MEVQNELNAYLADEESLAMLKEYRELGNEEKVIKERRDYIKYLLLRKMEKNEAIMSNDGQVIATYKAQIRTSFDSVKFKKDNPASYELYCKSTEVRTFLLK